MPSISRKQLCYALFKNFHGSISSQPAAPNRARDRFISLPDELHPLPAVPAEEAAAGVPTIFEDLVEGDIVGARGRITTYCVAEAIDRKQLELRLRERDSTVPLHSFPDVLYGRYESMRVSLFKT